MTALAIAGDLRFNPLTDTIERDGVSLRFTPPEADDLPGAGFAAGFDGFVAPSDAHADVAVAIAPDSQRLERLTPFPAWEGTDLEGLVVLLKSKGKTTTDHISAAGPWLKFRGHLTNTSGNLFLTVRAR